MKNGLVIADAGSIFSLEIIDKLELMNQFKSFFTYERKAFLQGTTEKLINKFCS